MARKKRRDNRTPAEIHDIKTAITDVCEAAYQRGLGGISVRSVFYQLVGREVVKKEEDECKYIGNLMTLMREAGELDWKYVKDDTRSMLNQHYSHKRSIGESQRYNLSQAIRPIYRYPLWYGQTHQVYLMTEKKGMTSLLNEAIPHALRGGVKIVPFSGFPSTTYVDDIAQDISYHLGNNLHVSCFYFGDWDKAGRDIYQTSSEKSFTKKLERYITRRLGKPPERLHVERIAVLEHQITELELPTRPPKKGDPYPVAVEIDAIPPDELIKLVHGCVWESIDVNALQKVYDLNREENDKLDALRERIDAVCDELHAEGWTGFDPD